MVDLRDQRFYWDRKPLLRRIYQEFFEMVRSKMIPGESLELGSGIGEFPYAEHSDLPLVSAYSIPRRDRSIQNLILIDVFHHLDEPERFLAEAKRVLTLGGRIIMLEPFVSPGSFFFFLFHNESLSVSMRAQKRFKGEKIVSFRWLLSGGYSHKQLYPTRWFQLMRKIDESLPKFLASRILIVINRSKL